MIVVFEPLPCAVKKQFNYCNLLRPVSHRKHVFNLFSSENTAWNQDGGSCSWTPRAIVKKSSAI